MERYTVFMKVVARWCPGGKLMDACPGGRTLQVRWGLWLWVVRCRSFRVDGLISSCKPLVHYCWGRRLLVGQLCDMWNRIRWCVGVLVLRYLCFSVDKKNQLDVTFCILYFSSNSCSTCFGQPCAHHQELTTASRSRHLLMMGTWLPETC